MLNGAVFTSLYKPRINVDKKGGTNDEVSEFNSLFNAAMNYLL